MQQNFNTVAFYSHNSMRYPSGRAQWHCFSNFSSHPINIDGEYYPTSEHYFQSKKPINNERAVAIQNAISPGDAAEMGRDRRYPIRKDWEDVKEEIMLTALRAKFSQNDYCYEALMGTGDAYIEERTKNDSYWGTGSDNPGGSGKNRLGHLLMQVRKELQEEARRKKLAH